MSKLLIATTNPAKLKSYQNLLKDYPLELVTLKDLNITEEAEEGGDSFEQTAIEKARFYYKKSGIPTLVDDGGFEIEALNGEPGVKSHRWIGREMTDEEIVAEVMKRMEGKSERSAKHSIVLAVATPFGVFTSHSEVAGVMAEKPT